QAVRRVLWLKALYDVGNPARAGDRAAIGTPDHLAAAQKVATDGVTLVRDRTGLVPLNGAGPGRVVIVGPAAAAASAMRSVFQAQGWQADAPIVFDLDADSIAAARQQALAAAPGADLLVVGTSSAGPSQRGLIDALLASGRPVAVVGFGLPYEVAALPDAPT